jgi:hypothetical protein
VGASAFMLARVARVAGVLDVLRSGGTASLTRLLDVRVHAAPVDSLVQRARLAMQGCSLGCVGLRALVEVAFLAQLLDWKAVSLVTVLMWGAMAALLCFLAEATLARTDLPPR